MVRQLRIRKLETKAMKEMAEPKREFKRDFDPKPFKDLGWKFRNKNEFILMETTNWGKRDKYVVIKTSSGYNLLYLGEEYKEQTKYVGTFTYNELIEEAKKIHREMFVERL